jgi:starch phosphorylase
MVREYAENLYEPAAAHADRMRADDHSATRSLAAWKQRVLRGWGDVRVTVEGDSAVADMGSPRAVAAHVALGRLEPADVAVQLLHGTVGSSDELVAPTIVVLTPVSFDSSTGLHRYEGSFTCESSGRYGFAVRVVPAHPHLLRFAELDRVVWA